jgi:hypothetical protein
MKVQISGRHCSKIAFLCYKPQIYDQMSMLTVKCPFLRTFDCEGAQLKLVFLINYGHFTQPKKLREKLQIFDRESVYLKCRQQVLL